MKTKHLYIGLVAAASLSLTSCIEEINPMTSTVTVDQAGAAPNAFNNFVNALTTSNTGYGKFGVSSYPWDYGYCSTFQMRDVMGQDMALYNSGSWYSAWAYCSIGLGPQYLYCQIPTTYFYSWIKDCNTVIALAGEEPAEEHRHGAGIAYAMRAMYYMDVARMFAPQTYGLNPQGLTAPIITEKTTGAEATHNPRATNEAMWAFILSDLDKAETYLEGYTRTDVYTPDVSVVYGLKARAYLTMEDWANAEHYAKLAQEGYTMMTSAQYIDRDNGFNTPNGAWMFGTIFKANNPALLQNDADSSWGSHMALEIVNVNDAGCGYASNYGYFFGIDRHLYSTIPTTDVRKKCFIDFSINDMDEAEAIEYLAENYSDYPETLYNTNPGNNETGYGIAGASVKFRVAGGSEGHLNQYTGFLMAVPYMRVEEMKLIEAEAAGMQNESRGIQLLTEFATARDPEFVYGTHNEAYGNASTSEFQNEVWWQRRVELWGEGFATFDIKRLNKGIIRSYAGTNHIPMYRWNSTTPPTWMTYCFVGTEADYNVDLIQNEIPTPPTSDSPEFAW